MKQEQVHLVVGLGIKEGGVLEGVKWWRHGFSLFQSMIDPTRQGTVRRCHCMGQSFDVDDFGRVYYPELLRFQVGVLDANGN